MRDIAPLTTIIARSARIHVLSRSGGSTSGGTLARVSVVSASIWTRSLRMSPDWPRTSDWNCARVAASHSSCVDTNRVPG